MSGPVECAVGAMSRGGTGLRVASSGDVMHQGGAVMKSCDYHVTCWYRDKERKYEERVKEVEKSFQQEMESMRESTKSTMLRLEADNARLRSEEEKLRDEIKHDRTVSGPLCQLLWCVSGGGGRVPSLNPAGVPCVQEVERLHRELDKTRHDLEAKEQQISSLLQETSTQLDVVHLVRGCSTGTWRCRGCGHGAVRYTGPFSKCR